MSSGWHEADWGQPDALFDWGDGSPGPRPNLGAPPPGEASPPPQGSRFNWPPSGPGLGGQYAPQGWGGRYDGSAPSDRREFFAQAGQDPGGPYEPSGLPSDIISLSRRDWEAILPLVPSGKQTDFYQPRNLQERIVQILGSVGASVVLSKTVVLAAPVLLYPVWSPYIRAAVRNLELYAKQFRCVGLWRAQVLEVTVTGWHATGGPGGPTVRILVGDGWPGGARVQLQFPYQVRSELVQAGESAELLVLCADDAFVTFKVVRELYLPESGLWLAEYPFVERGAFLDISLGIEQARQAQAMQQQQQQQGFR